MTLTEALSGPALNGQTPSGTATLTGNDGNEDCATSVLTQVSGVSSAGISRPCSPGYLRDGAS